MSEALISSFLLSLFVLLISAKVIGELFERIGLDSVIGELAVGLILGPSILNWVSPHTVQNFALVGAVLILFLAGLREENISAIATDRKALLIGLAMLVLCFIGFVVFLKFLPFEFGWIHIMFLALAYSVVDLGVPAKLLLAKNLLGTSSGKTILNTAVINIFTGLFLLTIISVFLNPTLQNILIKVIGLLVFVVVLGLLFLVMVKYSSKFFMLRVEEAQFALVFTIILLLAYLTEYLGLSNVVGAFLAGVIISRGKFSGTKAFESKLKAVSYGIFIPLFFVWFGLELNLIEIIHFIKYGLMFFALSVVIKFVVAYVLSKGMRVSRPGLVASSMLSLDVESLIIILLAVNAGLFEGLGFSPISVFAPSVLFTTILVALLVKVFLKVEKA